MTNPDPVTPTDQNACDNCPLIERRDFLRSATLALAGILAAMGASPALAESGRIRFGKAHSINGDERTYPVPAEDGATIDHDSQVILVRYQQKVYAFNLSCPHQNTALKWHQEDTQFQCPKHHSRYRPDGVFISGRATRGMDRFGVRHEGGNIVVDIAKFFRQDQNAAEWDAAFVAL
jgi:nitrite reductase/ring-hydroxylating ferredoxin subunit